MKRIVITTTIAFLAASGLALADVHVNPSETIGPIKPMNAVNNGPTFKGNKNQVRNNFNEYKALSIPYARTHDSALSYASGGPHIVDINQIFPDFSRNVNDPDAYDFTLTDIYLKNILEAGTQIFYRLGQSIEHSPKKYGVMPPSDYKKWAQICEHVILHYNEGWADGYHWNIRYWEIWNEPDLDMKTWKTNPRCWGGTMEEFFKFFEVAAKYLANRFPDLEIGGPALAGNLKWAESFLDYMEAHNVPLDFFSWHRYSEGFGVVAKMAEEIKSMLDNHGYGTAASIFDEWNYVKGWTDDFVYSAEAIEATKGAAYTVGMMSTLQDLPVDMAMYYDFRLYTMWCGAFNVRTNRPEKPYYAFYAWKKLMQYGTQVKAVTDEPDLVVTAAKSDSGRLRVLVTRYTEDLNSTKARQIKVAVEGINDGEVMGYLTDSCHIYTEIPLEVKDGVIEYLSYPDSFLLIEL